MTRSHPHHEASPARRVAAAVLAATALVVGCSTPPTIDRPDASGGDVVVVPATPGALTSTTPHVPPPEPAPYSMPMPPEASMRAGQALGGVRQGTWAELPGWQAGDDMGATWAAFVRNCQAVMARGARPAASGSAVVAAKPWRRVCAAAVDPATRADPARPDTVRQFMQQWLQPWRVADGAGKSVTGMVTGYYEPLVRASRVRGGIYQWPLYAVPADMLTIDLGTLYPELAGKRVRGKLDGKRVVPYDSRAELERSGRQPEALVWVDDPVDAFFLQVQGSGRAQLMAGPDAGRTIRLAYADQNGHTYASIGRWLVQQGELTLDQASMQNIKAWAKRNPQRVREMLNANPSVVFFREEVMPNATLGPRGAMSVPLTAEHSIAVDPQFVPLGAPVWLATTWPGTTRELNRMVMAQDTGSAIRGAARADFYWGYGEDAGALAGRMKQNGRMWVLWPKGAGAPAVDR